METEITRIGSSTTWGGINLLDGSYSKGSPIVFQIGPRSGNTLSFTMGYVAAAAIAAAQGTLGQQVMSHENKGLSVYTNN